MFISGGLEEPNLENLKDEATVEQNGKELDLDSLGKGFLNKFQMFQNYR